MFYAGLLTLALYGLLALYLKNFGQRHLTEVLLECYFRNVLHLHDGQYHAVSGELRTEGVPAAA